MVWDRTESVNHMYKVLCFRTAYLPFFLHCPLYNFLSVPFPRFALTIPCALHVYVRGEINIIKMLVYDLLFPLSPKLFQSFVAISGIYSPQVHIVHRFGSHPYVH